MSFGPPNYGDEANRIAKFLRKRDKYEALAWLKGSMPGSYRFVFEWPNKKSVDWVTNLYAVGAAQVLAVDFARNAGYESVKHLLINLPTDAKQRSAVFAQVNKQVEEQGFSPMDDTGQEQLLIWFS